MNEVGRGEETESKSEELINGSPSRRSFWEITRVGLIAGPLLALICFLVLPREYQDANGATVVFTSAGRATLAVMVWMAIWWLTEAIDLFATALLPLVVFPLFNIAGMKTAAAPYAHPLIFLFLGGFLLALSMQRWGLDRRIALLTLRLAGTKPVNMVAGFMLVTAVLSAFVSNTATAAMMMPIALSVVGLAGVTSGHVVSGAVAQPVNPKERNFGTCMMLGVAYAASIGGVATIIGTPPNVFLISFLRDSISEPFRMEISFARWMMIGVPFACVFLPIVWFLLTRMLYPVGNAEIQGGKEFIEQEYRTIGKMNRGEKVTFLVFVATATLWISRPLLAKLVWISNGIEFAPFAGFTDAGIGMTGALVLFTIPASRRPRDYVMNWDTAKGLPWGILILFGGGLSLAAAVDANGVAEFLGSQTRFASGIPDVVTVMLVCLVIVFLTELTSNTATTATLLPVLAALAIGIDIHPFLLVFPAAIAASCAFMLPVATPPNAIVFATGQVTIPQMAKAGIWLNLIAVVLVTLLTFFVIAPLLGIK